MKKKIFYFVITCVILTGCNNNYSKETSDYTNYMKTYQNENIEDGFHFIIPMNICEYCTKSTISKIVLMNDYKVTVVLTDYVKFNLIKPSSKLKKFNTFKDSNMSILESVLFFTGEFPMILLIKDKKIIDKIEVRVNENENDVDLFLKKQVS